MRRTIATLTTAVLIGALTVPSIGSAAPTPPELEDVYPVAPGLVRELRSWTTTAGPQRIQVLRFRLDDDRVDLRAELGMGQVAGREPVHQTVQRLGPEAVAGVNGGFWLATPDGDPEGLVVQDGRYVSEPATQGGGPRAAFALFEDDSWAVGRPDHFGEIAFPPDTTVRLYGINRQAPDEGIVALNAAYGDATGAPEGAVEAVFELDLQPNMLEMHEIVEVREAGGPLEPGQTVLVGTGRWASELAALHPGDSLGFHLRSYGGWDQAVQALAAGPMLVQDGVRVAREDWETEGFANGVHNDRAHPRTVIGFTADGEVLLVTVDGRQTASRGTTTDETIDLMLSLGADDALMLDGGGSSTMVVDGRITNRPCCDAPGYRWVANSLVVRSSVQTPGVTRLAGANRYATAAEVARHGWPSGSQHVFLANGTSFPDGLAGGPLAAALGVPLLLTPDDHLPEATRLALKDLAVRRVTVLGGTAAVDEAVESELTALGVTVDRLAGPDRWATAVEVARRIPDRHTTAILASGRGFADALAAVVPARAAAAPLLLSDRDVLPEPTRAALQELGITHVVLAGGTAVLSRQVEQTLVESGVTVERVAGSDRYETAAALVAWAERSAGLVPTAVAVAAGADFPDALAGGAFAASRGTPVLLSDPHSLERTGPPAAWLEGRTLDAAYVLGGRTVLSTWITHELQGAVASG